MVKRASAWMDGRYRQKQRQERAQQGPVQPGEDWEMFSRRRSSESHAPWKGGNSKDRDGNGLQGTAGQTGTDSRLGTGSGQRPQAEAGAAWLQSHWDAALPLGTSTTELDKGAAHTPLLIPAKSLGYPNPASSCPAIFVCTKPDNLMRGDSLPCLIRNTVSSVQTFPLLVFLSILLMCRSCVPGPGSMEPAYQALKATAARGTPAPQAPSLGMQLPRPASSSPSTSLSHPNTFCSWETWASIGAQPVGTPRAHTGLKPSPPRSFTQEKNKPVFV